MTDRMNRRNLLGNAIKIGCSCVLATGIEGCTKSAEKTIGRKESTLGSFCGLYCGACPLYQVSINLEDPAQIKCLGCKSQKLADHCLKCQMKPCAIAKGLDSCGQCEQFPCEKTRQFHGSGNDMATIAQKNCQLIRKKGYSSWLAGQPQRWICKKCGSKFSFKDESCPNCKSDVYSCKDEAADYRKS